MFFKLFLAFTIIPVIELWFLIKIGSFFGLLPTLVLVISTGIAGAALARLQGFHTMLKIRQSLQQGIMPKDELFDAFLILAAGIVLITPGILTDIFGIILLIPTTREVIKRFIQHEVKKMIEKGSITIHKP